MNEGQDIVVSIEEDKERDIPGREARNVEDVWNPALLTCDVEASPAGRASSGIIWAANNSYQVSMHPHQAKEGSVRACPRRASPSVAGQGNV